MILSLLKESTRALHDRVERAVDVSSAVRSLDSYLSLLKRFRGFYEPFEERLARAPGVDLPDLKFDARRKSSLLATDLNALGCSWCDPARVERCESLPDPRSIAATLGCLYVVEGSTLGGQIIRREVESRLGLTPDRGCAFFAGYGERLKPMWDEFRGVLTRVVTTPAAEAEAIAGATETFSAFERWMAGRDPRDEGFPVGDAR